MPLLFRGEVRVTTHLILEAKKRPIRRIGCFCLKSRPPPQGRAWFDFLPLRFPVKSQAHAWIRFCASFPLRTTSSCFRWSSLIFYSHLFCATPALPLWLFDLPCMPLPALSRLFGQVLYPCQLRVMKWGLYRSIPPPTASQAFRNLSILVLVCCFTPFLVSLCSSSRFAVSLGHSPI